LVPADSAGRTAQAQSHKAGRHAREESDRGEVPMNQPHKGVRAPAEVGEGRLRPKENMGQSHTPPAQNGERVSQGRNGVRQAARERKQERFTTLLHHLNVDVLKDRYYALQRQAAPGVDGRTWREYEDGLEDRLTDRHSRIHRGALALHEEGMVSLSSDKVCRASSLVVSTALAKSLDSEGRREATPVGHRESRGQDCPTGRRDHPQPDLRGGLPRLFVRVSARA